MLKTIGKAIAILLIISGSVWMLQGANILPGTFMRGDPQWIINGAIMAAAGGGLFWLASRK